MSSKIAIPTLCLIGLFPSFFGLKAEEKLAPQTLQVMSFNIRYDNPNDGPNAWPKRKHNVVQVVLDYQIEIVGMQEVLKHQLDYLNEKLRAIGMESYGVGRDNGKTAGEYSPIFFQTKRFQLLDQGTFWLSDKPEIPGSVSWDSSLTRICSWVQLKEKTTEKAFFVFNTHFDHRGAEARFQSAKLLRNKIKQIAGNLPVIVTGDFNCRPGSKPYQMMTHDLSEMKIPTLHDTKKFAKKVTGPDSSSSGFKAVRLGSRIDYVFVSPQFSVTAYEAIAKKYEGRFPSDHLPVSSAIKLEKD